MRTVAKSLCVKWPSVNARAGQVLCVPTILKEIKDLSKKEDYQNAFKLIGKYSAAKDEDLTKLQLEISSAIQNKSKLEKEKNLLTRLKSLSKNQLNEQLSIYEELNLLYPNNKNYTDKLNSTKKDIEKNLFSELNRTSKSDTRSILKIYQKLNALYPENINYIEKLDELEKQFSKEIALEDKQFGPRPVKNIGDESYLEVKLYLKQAMNDPSSLEMIGCSDVNRSGNGWEVTCKYRGKNAFGAKVINTTLFIIKQGHVISTEQY